MRTVEGSADKAADHRKIKGARLAFLILVTRAICTTHSAIARSPSRFFQENNIIRLSRWSCWPACSGSGAPFPGVIDGAIVDAVVQFGVDDLELLYLPSPRAARVLSPGLDDRPPHEAMPTAGL